MEARALLRRIEYEQEVRKIRRMHGADRRAYRLQMHMIVCVWNCWYDQRARSVWHRIVITRVANKFARRTSTRAWSIWLAIIRRSRTAMKTTKRWMRQAFFAAWGSWEASVTEARRLRSLVYKVRLKWQIREVGVAWTTWCDYRLRSAFRKKIDDRARRRLKRARIAKAIHGWNNRATHRIRHITLAKRVSIKRSTGTLCLYFKEWYRTRREAFEFCAMRNRRDLRHILLEWKCERFVHFQILSVFAPPP